MLSPGLDYIAIFKYAELRLLKEPLAVPALGIHYGLTNQLELGLRGFMPYTLEAIARYQLTPRNCKFFDLSANLHCGSYKIKYLPYLKSGFLIGKRIWFLEPFVGIFWYDPFEREYGNSRAINFGFGFPWRGATVIPEINWQFGNSNIKDGIGFFSIGFRMWK